ncbi:MAG TPA: ABC transporter ATP-binding protein [Myxococcales bacterium]|nr:ABC transporter [Deltaproteobacteria bacterium]MBU54782.1 ABC transporter [Deltaproteobacteria bacterium]HAA57776.1 ABC transporter ATP-binding protein [Myxococcales bacterium]|tara:strand:- start:15833 stop:17701 length:1869 start_codon:yes stop_codon:yes gene_type:complete
MTSHIRVVWRLLQGQRSRYAAAFLAMVVASCFLYLVHLLPQLTLDGVLHTDPSKSSAFTKWLINGTGGRTWWAQNLWFPALMIALFTFVAGLFTYLRGRWAALASEQITRDLRDRVYDKLQHLPNQYIDKADTGDLLQRCTSDIDVVKMFLSNQLVEIGRAITLLLVPLPLMYALHPGMTLVSALLLPFVFVFSLLFFLKIKRLYQQVEEAEAAMTTTIQENLAGIRVVRSFARQDFEIEKFVGTNGTHRQLHEKLYTALAAFWSTSDFICFTQQGLVLGFGLYWMATGSIQIGTFYFFLAAVGMFIWPFRMLGRILSEVGKATVALDRLQHILEQPTEQLLHQVNQETDEPKPFPEVWKGTLEFRDVTFRYDEDKEPVLRHLSFKMRAGETLALVGASGSGKSTILQLLMRFYEPTSGAIYIDGVDIATIPHQQLRALMSVVMQEPFLYSKTLHNNIGIAKQQPTLEEVVHVAMEACVHTSIMDFDDQYETVVGERGVTLSGGQRQRIALSRALLVEAPFLLLDDALSAVDTETEVSILRALRNREHTPSTLLVAHRLSSIMHADTILVLEHGAVLQRGTHQQLVEQEGAYKRIWQLQQALDEFIPTQTTKGQRHESTTSR